MCNKIITAIILLFISISSYSQLSSLNDPIRKSEAEIRSMTKDRNYSDTGYNPYGKALYCYYDDYTLVFTFVKESCTNVMIITTKNEASLDSMMYKFLYEKNYESANNGTLWGKML